MSDDSADARRRRFLEALGIDDFAGTGISFEVPSRRDVAPHHEEGLVAVINGDWREAQLIADFLLYTDEDERHRTAFAAVHAPIRRLLLEACDTALASDTDPIH